MDDSSDLGSFQVAEGSPSPSIIVYGEIWGDGVVNADSVVESNRDVVGNESVGHLAQDHGGTHGAGSSGSLEDGAEPLRGDSRPKVSHTGRDQGVGIPEGRSSGEVSPSPGRSQRGQRGHEARGRPQTENKRQAGLEGLTPTSTLKIFSKISTTASWL